MSKGSVLGPFVALKYLFEKPRTVPYPYRKRKIADRYRGFHKNDLEKCIGCGNCADICPCQAIDMVQLFDPKPKEGDTGKRPRFNYGRCTYCGLCVDVCPTGSLRMSQDFIHNDSSPDSFVAIAKDEKAAPELFQEEVDDFEAGLDKRKLSDKGYASDLEFTFAHLEGYAKEMEIVPAEERINSFVEMVRGFTREQAIAEAARCFECRVCEEACPIHMNIADYIRAIWEEDNEQSLRDIYKTNPLPGVCGRVCTHYCEYACAMRHRGDPVSIRWLKRYAVDQVPLEDYQRVLNPPVVKPTGKKIAIVGSGPAGLSAAYFLVLMGYEVTIFEEREKPGGMMRYGIPEYRLPAYALDKDIDYIKSLGVEIRCGVRVGKDVTLTELHREYDAVYVAIGLQGGRSTGIEGTDHPQVYQAVNLLRWVKEGKEIEITDKIVVIGGGNVAMDISRTLARLQKARYGKVNITVTCLESEDIMPADPEEIREAREEGIVIVPSRAPKKIEIEDDKIKGLHTVKCVSVFDEQGRFNPKTDEEDKLFLPASMIVEAIGQRPDDSLLEEVREELEFAGRRIKVNEYYQSSIPWLFFGGDLVRGPDVVNAIATGHQAARGIDAYLAGQNEEDA